MGGGDLNEDDVHMPGTAPIAADFHAWHVLYVPTQYPSPRMLGHGWLYRLSMFTVRSIQRRDES